MENLPLPSAVTRTFVPMDRLSIPSPQLVAGCVRAELARRQIRALELRHVLGLERTAIYDRCAGVVPFSRDEVAAVADHIGVPLSTLLGGFAVDARVTPGPASAEG